jgi:hypothetical protein
LPSPESQKLEIAFTAISAIAKCKISCKIHAISAMQFHANSCNFCKI